MNGVPIALKKETSDGLSAVRKPMNPSDAPKSLKLSGRVICAAVALPYVSTFNAAKREWSVKPRRGARAMYAGIRHLQAESAWDTTLVAWTGEILPSWHGEAEASEAEHENYEPARNIEVALSRSDKDALEEIAQERRGKDQRVVPVWMLGDEGDDPGVGETYERQTRWRKFADEALWPLLHYKLWHEVTDGRQERVWWKDFMKFNQAYADRIVSLYMPGDLIMVHDFHLMLLPQLIRQRLPDAMIGFCLHSPFPSSEIFRCLPKRKEVLAGLLGSDMIAFQSHAYVKHFISACTRVLGLETTKTGVEAFGAYVAVETLPIGIDAIEVEKQCAKPEVRELMNLIKETMKRPDGEELKIIIGRDRLDEVRGVLQKLQAFKRFLEEYPEWRKKVILIQITNPSVHDTTQLERDVADIIWQINNASEELVGASSVHHYHKHIGEDEYFALLKVADVGLITSVRDGMNVTGLEYVIAQKDKNGPVLLSEFTGTAGSLGDAIQVNPWDSLGVANAINQALTMPKSERIARQDALYKYVTTHSVQSWNHTFLKRLIENLAAHDHGKLTPALDRNAILSTYRKAARRLMLFDYDGTLTPIVREPSAAIPTDKVLRTLKKLAADPSNQIWIISGRDQAFLEEWLGDIRELGLSAEHGSFIRYPNDDHWVNLASEIDMGWQKDVIDVFQFFTERTQGSFIERKSVAITWHYRKADPDYGAFQAKECQAHLEQTIVQKYPVEVMIGKANLEVRPKNINKGEIVKNLVEKYPDGQPPEFIFCAGDDKTDEDMFRMLRKTTRVKPEDIYSVTIGASSKITCATSHLLEPRDMISTLGVLAGIEREQPTATPLVPFATPLLSSSSSSPSTTTNTTTNATSSVTVS